MDYDAQRELQQELSAGERLAWSGRPRQGLRLRAADAVMIPFSLMWGGFAFFWEWSVLHQGGPGFFALWGIPFVVIGLYMIFGRFFYDAWQRSRTYYGITDQRAIIRTARGVKSLSLQNLTDLSLKERGDRSGTIAFGAADPRYAMWANVGWPGTARYLPPSFEMIDNARQVYDQIRDSQRAMQQLKGNA
ncbi:MAG TPA: hypothetical protein VFO96_08555 [Gemmatimonadales bacterium]|jgi:hypothetical protein|nr:hypothetical protein [Gemmatimonadales bacterium]